MSYLYYLSINEPNVLTCYLKSKMSGPREAHVAEYRARIPMKAECVRLGARPSRKQWAKGRHGRPSAAQKAARWAGMAAPVVAISGAMAIVPALMTAPQVHQALAQMSPHTITAQLDAVVQSGTSTQSSSVESSAVQSDIANGNYLLAVGQYLVDNGYSTAAAAGIASCVDGESGGNPEAVGTGGGGLIGWTPIGSAAPNANIITSDVSQDTTTQLADILYYNSNEIGQSLVDELNSQTDPVAAADFYSQNFEKPAVTDSDVRPSVAEQVFSELGG